MHEGKYSYETYLAYLYTNWHRKIDVDFEFEVTWPTGYQMKLSGAYLASSLMAAMLHSSLFESEDSFDFSSWSLNQGRTLIRNTGQLERFFNLSVWAMNSGISFSLAEQALHCLISKKFISLS